MSVIPALRKLKQKDSKFDVSLGYIVNRPASANFKTLYQKSNKKIQFHSISTSLLVNSTQLIEETMNLKVG
jgi:hypothetical protein